MSNIIDLNSPPEDHKFNVSVEPKETSAEINVRLFKEVFSAFLFGILIFGFICSVGYICYETLVSNTTTVEEKKWAMSTITLITGGLIGRKFS